MLQVVQLLVPVLEELFEHYWFHWSLQLCQHWSQQLCQHWFVHSFDGTWCKVKSVTLLEKLTLVVPLVELLVLVHSFGLRTGTLLVGGFDCLDQGVGRPGSPVSVGGVRVNLVSFGLLPRLGIL